MDQTNFKTKMLVMAPVTIAIILLGIASLIEFEDNLSPVEQQVLNFQYRRLNIQDIQAAMPVNILKGAFDPGRFKQKYEMPGRPDTAANKEDLQVSLIIISGDSKMAIIEGRLVKEGDVIDDIMVVKIESDRVLLNNKENKWVYVKE